MGHGVIVVGAGLAGMMAAIAASDEGGEVALIDRGSVGLGTNTAMSNAVFTGVSASYGAEEYIRETMEIGRFLNRRFKVEIVAEKSPEAVAGLKALGVPINPAGNLYQVKSPNPRVVSGVTMVKQVAAALRSRSNIHVVRDFYVTGIMKEDGAATGIEGIDEAGRRVIYGADAVVLATGGAGAIYLRNDNQKGIMGQGYYLAAMAGLSLLDMEFVQFFPLVVAGEGLAASIVYPPMHEAIRLVNSAGEDLAVKYNMGSLSEAVMRKRDELSIDLYRETEKGTVFLDYRKVPDDAWNVHPLSLLRLIKHDFKAKPLPVSPAVHFMMGGVRTDEACRTDLPGLFACGEVTWGLHGANRRGGNALMECAVFGTLAGRNAAQFKSSGPKGIVSDIKGPWEDRTAGTKTGHKALGQIKDEIRRTAWVHAGVIRSADGLKKGLDASFLIGRDLEGIISESRREVCVKADLTAAVVTLKAVITASLGRQESRGSFYRDDFPREDDVSWRKNSSLTYDSATGSFAVDYVPVN